MEKEYIISPRPDRKGQRTVFANNLEEAVREGYALWEEYGKPRPMRMGAICMATGETLDETTCEITGNHQVIRGKATDPGDILSWKEIPPPRGVPRYRVFWITPTPDSADKATQVLAADIDEALKACIGLWAKSGKRRPELLNALDPMRKDDIFSELLDDGTERRFYGKSRVKNGEVKWQVNKKKNKKMGWESPSMEYLMAE